MNRHNKILIITGEFILYFVAILMGISNRHISGYLNMQINKPIVAGYTCPEIMIAHFQPF